MRRHRCSHCRQLHPTWETLAEIMTDVAEKIVGQRKQDYSEEELEHAKKVELPVMIAKVDCVDHAEFCRKQRIMAYPTLRLFVDGERWKGGDYRGHRTVVDFTDYLQQIEGRTCGSTGFFALLFTFPNYSCVFLFATFLNVCIKDSHKTDSQSDKDKNVELAHKGTHYVPIRSTVR